MMVVGEGWEADVVVVVVEVVVEGGVVGEAVSGEEEPSEGLICD